MQIIGWQFLFKFLLQGQLLSLYASECWICLCCTTPNDECRSGTPGENQLWNSIQILQLLLCQKTVSVITPKHFLRLKTCFYFFFSFNKFKMLKYIAPSHSLLVLCGVKGMGGSEDEWASALYVYCVCGPVLEENLRPKISYCSQKLSCWASLLPDAQPRKLNSKASQKHFAGSLLL